MARQQVIGLDIGAASTKLAIVERHRSGARLVHTARLDQRDEGIDGFELAEVLTDWLRQECPQVLETTAAIPQTFVNMRVAEFPPADGKRLAEMAAYEVQQFSGLSDESFLHAFHPLDKAGGKGKQPVLLAICPETAALERADLVSELPVQLCNLAPSGAALAAAFRQLHPKQSGQHGVTLVLDLGASSTTFLIFDAGHFSYAGSVPYGAELFTDAMAHAMGIREDEAERLKRAQGLKPADKLTPPQLIGCCSEFVSELFAALESWKFDGEAAVRPTFDHVYLCGGGARLQGFDDYLAAELNCPVELLRSSQDAEQDDYLVAFGLGMQGLGVSTVPMPLTPQNVCWQTLRRRRHVFLAAAMFLIPMLLAAIVAVEYFNVRKEQQSLDRKGRTLDECGSLIPGLEKQRAELANAETMLKPFVARGNRNRVVIKAIDVLTDFQQEEDWLVLLADPESYHGDPEEREEEVRRPRGLGAHAMLVRKSEKRTILCEDVAPWDALYCSGFIPKQKISPLEHIRSLREKLNSEPGSIFTGADVVTSDRSTKDYRVSAYWLTRYIARPFALRLPLKDLEFKSQ